MAVALYTVEAGRRCPLLTTLKCNHRCPELEGPSSLPAPRSVHQGVSGPFYVLPRRTRPPGHWRGVVLQLLYSGRE